MAEKINRLHPRDYTKPARRGIPAYPRRTIHFVGETAQIRLIDARDKQDMQRFRAIDQTLPAEFVEEGSTDKELIDMVKENFPGNQEGRNGLWTFGLAGLKNVEQNEIGELHGEIMVYKDTNVSNLVKEGFIPASRRADVVEVAYGKLNDTPASLMISGIRQVCLEISRVNSAIEKKSRNPDKPYSIVIAYVKPQNESEGYIFSAAGFDNKGRVIARDGKDTEEYDLFMLDWDRLHASLQKRADTELFKKPQPLEKVKV